MIENYKILDMSDLILKLLDTFWFLNLTLLQSFLKYEEIPEILGKWPISIIWAKAIPMTVNKALLTVKNTKCDALKKVHTYFEFFFHN